MRHENDADQHDRHRPARARSTNRKDAKSAQRRKRGHVLLGTMVTTALVAATLASATIQDPSSGDRTDDPDLSQVSSALTAAPTTAATANVTAPTIADTYVVASQPRANNGRRTWTFATRAENRAFLKFDTAKVVPKGMVVRSAALRVFVLNIDVPAPGFTAFPLKGVWSERFTTARNRPAFTPAAASPAIAVPRAREWVTLPINAAAVSTTGATSLELLHSVTGSDLQLGSRESATPPSLQLVVAPAAAAGVPTTTTTTKAAAPPTSTTTAPAEQDAQPASSDGVLPFDLPSRNTLQASKRLVFAHYFTPFPISLDNKDPDSDYYTKHYLDPMGESGKHKAYGGFVKNRPLPRKPLSGDYAAKDFQTEVSQAVAAGLDGFTVDMLSLTSHHWTRVVQLLEAAHEVDTDFKIMLQPDMTTLNVESPDTLAAAVAKLAKNPAAFRLGDGRLVVSPFKAENHSAAWWKDWLALLKSKYGVDVAFVPVFLDWEREAQEYASISYGFSSWGMANTTTAAKEVRHSRLAHNYGKVWMAPVRVQDVRPNQSIFDESDNSRTLRMSWEGVIDGEADWVHIPTWNDYSEGTEIAPSARHGWSFLDISSYYISRWKTGVRPEIKRDGLYLVHRTQRDTTRPTFPQSMLMSVRPGTPSPVNEVEVVSFLKAAATVTVSVGSNTYTWDAPAGMSAKDFPLDTGTVSAKARRDGSVTASVTSPFTVTGSPYVQNLEYAAVSSLR